VAAELWQRGRPVVSSLLPAPHHHHELVTRDGPAPKSLGYRINQADQVPDQLNHKLLIV